MNDKSLKRSNAQIGIYSVEKTYKSFGSIHISTKIVLNALMDLSSKCVTISEVVDAV